MCSRSVWFIWEVPDLVDQYSLFANFEVRSTLRSEAIVIITDGRTDRHSSNVLEFRADQMSPTNLGS